MRLLLPLGLLVALAVVGPLVAHLLRRRRPEERPFPPARLVPRAPPVARRRAFLEDRALLSLRVLGVLALALLAASPLVRCSSLSLDRRGGASIALAIVIDDSMSMSAELPSGARRDGARTRFELAMVAARELGASLRSGDAVAIVLAGAPARVVLPSTTDVGVVRATLEQIARDGVSDRATDLDGAVALATAGMRDAPHADRRVVLLSDLADGQPQALALAGDAAHAELAAPLDALRAAPPQGAADCAIVLASPEPEGGVRDAIRVRVACALRGATRGGRGVEIVTGDASAQVVGQAALPATFAEAPATFDVVVPIDRKKAPNVEPSAERPSLLARLTGVDALARDDVAPVLGGASAPILGVVVAEGGAVDEVVATGGAPILERGLRAIESGSPVRPLPSVPDREVDLAPYAGLAIDDPPGFAPETRAALTRWIERGGVLLLGAGARVASPPLGSSFEPALLRAVRWERIEGRAGAPAPPLGVDPAHAGPFANGADAPADLAPRGRALFDREDVERSRVAAAFGDAAPLLLRRTIGEGEAWIVALPFSAETSDLPLRPGFLGLLDAWIARARERGAGARLEIGQAWSAGADDALEAIALGPRGDRAGDPLAMERAPDAVRVRPRALGSFLVTVTPKGGAPRREVRAVTPAPREVDLAARPLAPSVAAGAKSGLERATVPLGPALAALVTALAAIELFVRAARLLAPAPRKRDDEAEAEPEPTG